MRRIIATILFVFILPAAFGCFIMFLTDGKNILVGNHEDWYGRDAEVSFIPASGNKLGMVYFDFASEKTAQGGMNEAGLFFDGTRTPNSPYPANDKKKDCHCYIWTKILAECTTVEQAIGYLKQFKIAELEDIHVMFADKHGHSAVAGVYNGELQLHLRSGNYQLLTNFNPSNPSYGGETFCTRYAAADSMLHADSSVTIENIQEIFAKTHQEDLTIYSNIYNLTTGDVYIYSLYTRNNFTNKIKLNLAKELKKGKHSILLTSLFKNRPANKRK
jgi:predicted choloylglycine hydrolase